MFEQLIEAIKQSRIETKQIIENNRLIIAFQSYGEALGKLGMYSQEMQLIVGKTFLTLLLQEIVKHEDYQDVQGFQISNDKVFLANGEAKDLQDVEPGTKYFSFEDFRTLLGVRKENQ